MSTLGLTTILLASAALQQPQPDAVEGENEVATAPAPADDRAPPDARQPRLHQWQPLEVGVQFGGMRILENPVATSSLYLGGRADYRLPYQIVVGVVAQYDAFSSRTSTGSDFSFWATRGEIGYELSQNGALSVLPYAELGYASTNTLRCIEPHDCSRTRSDGSVGAIGLRFVTLGNHYYSGFDVNYQVGHVRTLFFGLTGGFRL